MDLIKQKEIELRRRRDGFTTLHRNTSRLLLQAEQSVNLFRKESDTARKEVEDELARLRSNRFRKVVWAGFGGPKPYPNFTAEEESAVRPRTGTRCHERGPPGGTRQENTAGTVPPVGEEPAVRERLC